MSMSRDFFIKYTHIIQGTAVTINYIRNSLQVMCMV